MAPSTVFTLVVTTSTTKTSEKVVFQSTGETCCCCTLKSTPPTPAIAPDSAKTTMRCQAGFTPSPAVAVSLPRMAARLRPTVPLRTSITMTTATMRTAMARRNVAWPSKLKNALVPSHFDFRLVPCAPPVTQMSLKAVLSKSKAAARVMSASPRPRKRNDKSARRTATMAAKAQPMRPPTRKLSPRWTENTAAVKAPMPANVAWHSDN